MANKEKVIKALERCLICDTSVIATPEAQKAYLECEYTVGLYCGQKRVLRDALSLLKEQEAKWVYGEDETGVDGWHCSECNFFEPWFYEFTDDIDFIRFYEHCPSCGRKMTSYTGGSPTGDEVK